MESVWDSFFAFPDKRFWSYAPAAKTFLCARSFVIPVILQYLTGMCCMHNKKTYRNKSPVFKIWDIKNWSVIFIYDFYMCIARVE